MNTILIYTLVELIGIFFWLAHLIKPLILDQITVQLFIGTFFVIQSSMFDQKKSIIFAVLKNSIQ